MICKFFPRKKFDNLVKQLRSDKRLNEERLRLVIAYRDINLITYKLIYSVIGPLWLCLFIYINYYGNSDSSVAQAIIVIIAFLPLHLIYVCKRNIDQEWKYVYLMTEGNRCVGDIVTLKPLKKGAYCVYSFHDESGKFRKAKMKLHGTSNLKSGEQVKVMYDFKNPKCNMVVYPPDLKIFNLRKNN